MGASFYAFAHENQELAPMGRSYHAGIPPV
jgi:hypothetical protein